MSNVIEPIVKNMKNKYAFLNNVQNEASKWKEKGNEMFRWKKFDMAIDCYTLSIQYVAVDNAQLMGTLYGNRSQAYFKKKQFNKAKDDAEKCLKYRPNWSKVMT